MKGARVPGCHDVRLSRCQGAMVAGFIEVVRWYRTTTVAGSIEVVRWYRKNTVAGSIVVIRWYMKNNAAGSHVVVIHVGGLSRIPRQATIWWLGG